MACKAYLLIDFRFLQIFELLLEGKKRSEIEEECSLSEGTVKTHITNLYRKLEVHSKKEMADLFEKESRELEAKQG